MSATLAPNAPPFGEVRELMRELHPLLRIHNSDDMERTMRRTAEWIRAHGFRGSTRLIEVPAGSVHDHWRVPGRWRVRAFSVRDPSGRVVVDATSHPLSLMPHSDGFRGTLSRAELLEHVRSRDDLPDAIPFVFRKLYRHWETGWAIALPQRTVDGLPEGRYEVEIDTAFADAPMVMLEYRLPGRSADTLHLAAHIDHPGQANDGLSGALGALCAVRALEDRFASTDLSYTVLLCPEIVGSAHYLADPARVRDIRLALCPNMLGHAAPLALCLSKRADSQLDRALALALWATGADHVVGRWHKYPDCGDEISYDSPGIGIPTSTLSRVGERFRYYHTSLDTPDAVDARLFSEAVEVMAAALGYIERSAIPVRTFSGNPCLAAPELDLYLDTTNISNRPNRDARRDLFDLETGALLEPRNLQEYFLSNLEGNASLIDLAYEARVPFDFIAAYARAFAERGLIELRTERGRTSAGTVVPVSLTLGGSPSLT